MPSRASSESPLAARVADVRRFNRFYTRLVGALGDGHLDSPFSLTEVRVLFELAHRDAPTAAQLVSELALDPGYVSRLLQRLQRRRLVTRRRSERDGRESHVELTAAGRTAFNQLDRQASARTAEVVGALDDAGQRRLVESMRTIGRLLGADQDVGSEPAYILRPPRAGDLGWVVQSHGELYAREYGWGAQFEALVAHIVADFVDRLELARERCWIAERRGENVGSVFVVKHPDRPGVARLRLLLVHPSARGLGIGRRLVDECTRFARDAGYHTLSLWTHAELSAARKIYAAAGYTMIGEEVHDHFGRPLTAETWEMPL